MVVTPPAEGDPGPIRLWLDEEELTDRLTILETMTWPPSRREASFRVASDLTLGDHEARVSFSGPSGPQDHRWSFVVVRGD